MFFFRKKVVEDSHLIATKNSCPSETFYGQLPEKESAFICCQVC